MDQQYENLYQCCRGAFAVSEQANVYHKKACRFNKTAGFFM
jgi:hypothetical protein